MNKRIKLEELAREACRCRYCFDHFGLKAPTIAIAQPRWVGPNYWTSSKKILIVMLNPGSGENRNDDADQQMYQELLSFRDSKGTTLDDVFSRQANDMPNWGRHKNFWPYYFDGLGLKPDEVAFANVAWCATVGNMYPPEMLLKCYDRFTSRLITILSPRNILLSGSKIQKMRSMINQMQQLAPDACLIPMKHFAHREGHLAEEKELQRVRELLKT